MPRDGKGKPRIIETDAFFQFHFANGYEEDGALVLDLCRYPDYLTIGQALREYWKSDWPSYGMATPHASADRSFDRQGRHAAPSIPAPPTSFPSSTRPMSASAIATPTSPAIRADRMTGLQQQLAKVDFQTGAVLRHDFGPNGYPGEPFFIATPRRRGG